MATSKAYTDIEQSRKLAEILPIESADMRYAPFGDTHPWVWDDNLLEKGAIPCWSLASLFNYLREVDFFPKIDADEVMVTMNINYYDEEEARLMEADEVMVTMDINYFDEEEARLLAPIHNIKVKAESFIDACVELISKLREQKLL